MTERRQGTAEFPMHPNLDEDATKGRAKLPIDRPCSACSAGDYDMQHHDHAPPFSEPALPELLEKARDHVGESKSQSFTEAELEHMKKVAKSIPVVDHPQTYPDSAFALFDELTVLLYDEDGQWRVQTELADGTKAIISVNNRQRGEQARVQIRGIALQLLGHFLKRGVTGNEGKDGLRHTKRKRWRGGWWA